MLKHNTKRYVQNENTACRNLFSGTTILLILPPDFEYVANHIHGGDLSRDILQMKAFQKILQEALISSQAISCIIVRLRPIFWRPAWSPILWFINPDYGGYKVLVFNG
jgi:hypothetical protein